MKNSLSVYLLIIILSSVAVHFAFFGQPRETVFDEVHFGKFISGYFTHEYFFDIHPPLGKLMISGIGYMTGFKPGFSFAKIGQQFPDQHYLWLRLLPTVTGTLLPIVVYFLILQLGISRLAAFTGGTLVILENALLVQSRFILLDSFLLLFGFSALLFYFKFQNLKTGAPLLSAFYLLLSGLFAAFAISVKWTGATFMTIIIFLEIIRYRFWIRSCLKATLIKIILSLIVTPAIVYFSIFALHFSLLNKSGPGDAFMTPRFRKTLADNTDSANIDLKPLNLFQKFNELNLQMYKSNATLTASHPYSSNWYTWPFMIRPIYYWNKANATADPPFQTTNEKMESRIYFLGNPVIWWASTIAMFFLIVNLILSISRLAMSKILKKFHDIASRKIKMLPILLVGAYLFNLLPFISIKRAMFLYHYLIGLIFAIIALVYLIDQLHNKKRTYIVLLAVSIAAFIFFMPLTYGLPLSERAYHFRVWLNSWL